MLPQSMDTSSSNSPYFIAYQAAQVNAGDQGFLSSHITVSSLMQNQGDKHHFYPRKHLQRLGYQRGKYNQIANFVITLVLSLTCNSLNVLPIITNGPEEVKYI